MRLLFPPAYAWVMATAIPVLGDTPTVMITVGREVMVVLR